MPEAEPRLRSQRLRMVNHQGDALRLGMNWTEEYLANPQVLVAPGSRRARWSKSFSAICFLESSGSGGLAASAIPMG